MTGGFSAEYTIGPAYLTGVGALGAFGAFALGAEYPLALGALAGAP